MYHRRVLQFALIHPWDTKPVQICSLPDTHTDVLQVIFSTLTHAAPIYHHHFTRGGYEPAGEMAIHTQHSKQLCRQDAAPALRL